MNIIYLEEVDSTNLYAKANLENLADRSVVLAKRQTAGKGRLQRSWVDLGEGNLFVSVVLKPSRNFDEKYSNLTQYLSVVLTELLDDYDVEAEIKWPNDVLVNGRKIAGILCESVIKGEELKGLILGLGVNLNADMKDFCKVADKEVTSLNNEIGVPVDVSVFLNSLLEKFFDNYDNFLTHGFKLIKNDYISRANFLGAEICVQVFNDKKIGIVKTITDNGELVLAGKENEFVLKIGEIL